VSRLVSDQAVSFDYAPKSSRHGVYIFVLEGEVQCDSATLGRRDSAGVWGADRVRVSTGTQESDLLIVESVA
jgi:hypothetical protein